MWSLVSVPGKHLHLVCRPVGWVRTSEAPPGPEKPFWLGHNPNPTPHSSACLWLTSAAQVLSPTFWVSERAKGPGDLHPPGPVPSSAPRPPSLVSLEMEQLKSQEDSLPPQNGSQGWQNLGSGHCASLWGQGPFEGLSPAFCKTTWAWDHQDSVLMGSTALPPPLALGLCSWPAVLGRWAAHLRPQSKLTGRPGARGK